MKKSLLVTVTVFVFITAAKTQTDSALVNGYHIHYLKKGIGSPPIIFVSGMAHDHATWQIVQDSMAKTNLTVSYDRAGLGEIFA